jgi:hypothetical protein
MALAAVMTERLVHPVSMRDRRTGGSRHLTVAVAAALLLLVVGGQDVGAGSPASRPTGRASARPAPDGAVAAQARRDGVDVDRVVDTVRHRMVAGPSGVLVSEDERYRAVFDADGFEVGLGNGGEGLRISTTAVARDSTPTGAVTGPWRGEANVAVRSLGPGLSERVTATAGQLEWDVVLASRPAGHGALHIDARVTGASGAPGRSNGGLAWTVGDRKVAMGELVVKDRDGVERFRAAPESHGSGVRLTVPASVLDGAAYPLVVDPVIGPELPVSDPVPAPAAGDQGGAQLAYDGTNYLLVWSDTRAGFGFGPDARTDIFGARIDRSGVVLDPTGVLIARDGNDPVVAYDGTNYLVAWTQGRVQGTRVSRAGQVLGPSFPIGSGDEIQVDLSIAFDGTNHLVVWSQGEDLNRQSDVYGARVGRDGAVVDPAGILIAGTGVERLGGLSVAFDGANYLVVWHDFSDGVNDIRGARLSRAGQVLDPTGIAISVAPRTAGAGTSVAFDGTNYLVVWTYEEQDGDVYGARVSRAGVVLDPEGIRISPAVGTQSGASLAFDGMNYLVAFADNRDGILNVSGARVSRGGVVRDPTSFPISRNPGTVSAVGFDGTNHLVVWSAPGSDYDIEAARVTRAGAVRDGIPISVSTSANNQTAPDVVFDGTDYFVVWQDNRSGSADIYGARVAPGGTLRDGAGILIAGGIEGQVTPAVVFDGTNVAVVWQQNLFEGIGVGLAFVRPDGSVSLPVVLAGGDSQRPLAPDIAFDGTNYLVVWGTGIAFAPGLDWTIHGARVGPDGALLDQFVIATDPSEAHRDPVVGFDGEHYLVVWSSNESIVGTRIDRDGGIVDPAPFVIAAGAGFIVTYTTPALAFDGTNHLVVWQQNWRRAGQDVGAARVSPSGQVLDPSPIRLPPGPGGSSDPAVAFNGSFLVVWQDRRPRATGGVDVYGARVRRNGTVADATAFPIAAHADDEFGPAVTAGPGDRWGVVSHRFVDEASFHSHRVLLREVAPK